MILVNTSPIYIVSISLSIRNKFFYPKNLEIKLKIIYWDSWLFNFS